MKILAIILLGLVTTFCSASDNLSFRDVIAKSEQQNKPTLLVFGAKWCGPCKILKEDVASGNLVKELSSYDIVFIDIDDFPEIAKEYKVNRIPDSRIVIGKKEKANLTGYNRSSYKKWLIDNEVKND